MCAVPAVCPTPPLPITPTWWPSVPATTSRIGKTRGRCGWEALIGVKSCYCSPFSLWCVMAVNACILSFGVHSLLYLFLLLYHLALSSPSLPPSNPLLPFPPPSPFAIWLLPPPPLSLHTLPCLPVCTVVVMVHPPVSRAKSPVPPQPWPWLSVSTTTSTKSCTLPSNSSSHSSSFRTTRITFFIKKNSHKK